MDKAAAEAEHRRDVAEQAEKLAIQHREAEERAAEQVRKQREANEKKSAELQGEITELSDKRDNLKDGVETYEETLSDIQKRTAKAEEELVRKQEIPPPPKKPFDRKPTPPICVPRDVFIYNSVNRDLGLFERKKQEKEVGESYDTQMSEYFQRLALWEQYERDLAAYTEKYGLILTVQNVAAQQALTAKEQAKTAQALEEREAVLKADEATVEKERAHVRAERASMGAEIERRVQQALRKAQTFIEYGRTSAQFNALFKKFIGNGETYDEARQRREQKKADKVPVKKSQQKGYGDI